jgi:hypothetical protein
MDASRMSGVDVMGRRRALIETSNLAKIDERKNSQGTGNI